MSKPYSDAGQFIMAKLSCCVWPNNLPVTFESATWLNNASVKVTVGEFSGLISREELAALAALFPVEPKQSRAK